MSCDGKDVESIIGFVRSVVLNPGGMLGIREARMKKSMSERLDADTETQEAHHRDRAQAADFLLRAWKVSLAERRRRGVDPAVLGRLD